jgi:hypothetical protein
MTSTADKVLPWLRSNWFIPIAAIVVLGDLSAVRLATWSVPEVLEAALLFDFAVMLPALYWWCYRSRGRAAVIRALAICCLGIWVAGKALPADGQPILDAVGWLRYVGIAGLVILEIKILLMLWRAIFGAGISVEEARQKIEAQGMPPWVARLMEWEAALYRKVWLFVRRVFRRK